MRLDLLPAARPRPSAPTAADLSAGAASSTVSLVRQASSLLARRIEFREVASAGALNPQPANKAAAAASGRDPSMPLPPPLHPARAAAAAAGGIFPAIDLHLSWPEPLHQGPGLQNLGNTCFLNSTLQCLTYTPPLAVYAIRKYHGKTCRQNPPCMFCELEKHVTRCFAGPRDSHAICPKTIVGRLKFIAKHLRVGRQEDAHEFLRYFVDSLQNSCLAGHGKLTNEQKEGTAVHQIFGGYLQSKVQCTVCKHASVREDPVLDFSLEINTSSSLERAFAQFTQAELLHGDNKYKCDGCKKMVNAHKRMTILSPPPVLVVHLKRFNFPFSSYGSKITKAVKYPLELNLQPFLTQPQGRMIYNLYGVLVHSGHSCNSGHYYSFVKGPNGVWYCMNDTEVRQVGVQTVLNQSAYMLFYVAESKERTAYAASRAGAATAASNPKVPAEAGPPAASPASVAPATSKKRKNPTADGPRENGSGLPEAASHAPQARPAPADKGPGGPSPTVVVAAQARATDRWAVLPPGGKPATALPAGTSAGGPAGLSSSSHQARPAATVPAPSAGWKVSRTPFAGQGDGSFPNGKSAVASWDADDVGELLHRRDRFLASQPVAKRPRWSDLEYERGRKKKRREKPQGRR